MKVSNFYKITFSMFVVLLLNSCQINSELASVSSKNPSSQQILSFIKNTSEYSEYLSINQKIEESMPKAISSTTKEQKVLYNSIISKYTNKFDIFKTKDIELVHSISDITKSLEGLRNNRLDLVKSIYSKILKKYPALSFKEVISALYNDNKSNARISSCSSEAYAASWNSFEYALQVYGDASFAYMFADWVYSKTYMSCIDPIGNGSGMAMA